MQPVLITFDAEPTPSERLLRFLGHYDTRIYVTGRSYLDFGIGSLGTMAHLKHVHEPDGFEGCLGSVGRWCEMDPTAEVHGRGEHDNDRPVNVSLGLLAPFGAATRDFGMKPMTPIQIGHGVVLSAGARVMSGASVGDGAVVGAGAIVRGDVEPFGIAVGAPATTKRLRPPFQPWWNFSVAYLIANRQRLNELALSDGPHEWQPERPRFVLKQTGSTMDLIGFSDGGVVLPLAAAPPAVRDYVDQAFSPGPSRWVADCWSL